MIKLIILTPPYFFFLLCVKSPSALPIACFCVNPSFLRTGIALATYLFLVSFFFTVGIFNHLLFTTITFYFCEFAFIISNIITNKHTNKMIYIHPYSSKTSSVVNLAYQKNASFS